MNYSDTIKIETSFNGFIAHRGLSLVKVENTIESFTYSSKKNYFGLECDLHSTKDNFILISHDNSLKRVFDVDKNITDETFESIRSLKLIKDGKCYQIPTLSEYIDIAKQTGKEIIVELKETLSKDNIDSILETIKGKEYISKTTFISFYPGYLTYVREQEKHVRLLMLLEFFDRGTLEMCIQYNIGIDINYKLLNKNIVNLYHKYNLIVNCYTVDDKDIALKLIEMGVDYITTDCLEKL